MAGQNMTPVTIANCRVSIIRHGGWQWGKTRRELAHQAVEALPQFIIERIAHLASSGIEVEIQPTLMLNIRLSMAQFMAILDGVVHKERLDSLWSSEVGSKIESAIQRVILPHINSQSSRPVPATGREGKSTELGFRTATDLPNLADSGLAIPKEQVLALLQLLVDWRKQDVLSRMLQRMSVASLRMWHERLLSLLCRETGSLVDDKASVIHERLKDEQANLHTSNDSPQVAIIHRFAHMLDGKSRDLVKILRYRMAAVAEVVYQFGIQALSHEFREALEQHLPWHSSASPEAKLVKDVTTSESTLRILPHSQYDPQQGKFSRQSDTHFDRVPRTLDSTKRGTDSVSKVRSIRSVSNSQTTSVRDIPIPSALPFLILRPLTDLGYLRTLAMCMQAADLEELLPAFAVTLAYKVLDPPERGWRRSPTALRTAFAMAGLVDDSDTTAPNELARYASDFVSPLNAVLSQAILSGHETKEPWLIASLNTNPPTCMLTDSHGMFPTLIETEEGELLSFLSEVEPACLLIEAGAAKPALLKELHRLGCRFLIDVPPTRGERWRRLSAQGRRWWTNDALTPATTLLKYATRFDESTQSAQTWWNAMSVQRPVTPHAADQQLDHAVTLAAGVALAQIAWDMWRGREHTDPMLTLERFGDLDAVVQLTDTEVRVRLPLGRRSMDLFEQGLLEDIVGVPWLGKRIIKFTKG